MKYFLSIIFLLIMTAIQAQNEESGLVVRGSATLLKPADQIELSISIVSQDKDPKQALQENNRNMQSVLNELISLGLSKSEYQTGQFNINPVYTTPPKELREGWEPKISHYEVTNTLIVKTEQLELAGTIISAVTQAGSNKIEYVHFNLKDPQLYRSEAIEAATRNAFADAHALSQAAHVNLNGIKYLSLDEPNPVYPVARQAFFAAKENAMMPVPLEGGMIEVKASVQIIFNLKATE